MTESATDKRREPISPERLAQIREECGPRSVYLSGVAGDGLVVMANELLDEIDRLTEVLDANRVVRNAAESSSRTYKGAMELLKTQRTQLRAELDKCAALNINLVNENADLATRAETAERELARQREGSRDVAKRCMDAMERATTAERELAELRERIGKGETPNSHCPWCGMAMWLDGDGLAPLHDHPVNDGRCPGIGRRPSDQWCDGEWKAAEQQPERGGTTCAFPGCVHPDHQRKQQPEDGDRG